MIQPVREANRQAREDKIEVGEPDYALEAYDTIYMSVLHILPICE
jgi:hypothetical protein